MSRAGHLTSRLTLKRRVQIYLGAMGIVVLAYYIEQRWTAHVRETIPARRMAVCAKADTIKLALIFPETYRTQFLQGAELALSLRNAKMAQLNAEMRAAKTTSPLHRQVEWTFVEEQDENDAKTAIALSRDPALFAVAGYYFSKNASRASVIFEKANVLTMITSANSTRLTNHEFESVFSTAPTTDVIARKVLPAVSYALERLGRRHPAHTRLAIIRTPGIYANDLCRSLLADLSIFQSLRQFCATYEQLIAQSDQMRSQTLADLVFHEKISHQTRRLVEQEFRRCLEGKPDFANVPFPHPVELAEKWKETPPQQLPLEILVPIISDHVMDIEVVIDVIHKDDPHSALKVITHLGESRPDAVFFAAEPSPVNLELIREIRLFGGEKPLILPAGFDNPKVLAAGKAFLGELYVISHYDAQTHGKELAQLAETARRILPERQLAEFEPSLLAMEGYEGLSVLLQAIDRFPDRYPEAIKPVLHYAAPKGWNGLHSPLIIGANGSVGAPPLFLKRHVDGQLVDIEAQ